MERGVTTFAAKLAVALVLIALSIVGTTWAIGHLIDRKLAGADPITVANSALQGLQEQNRLSAFAARFVSVATTTKTSLGLSARRTLIMPGLVRYEVDLAKLQQRDVTWDAKTKTLGVTLPLLEVDPPQIDLTQITEYDAGGMLSHFGATGAELDAANRKAGQADLVAQAHAPTTMNLARDATRRAVERSFAMPLRAAGLDASVKVRFADEPVRSDEHWDTSSSLQDVLGKGS